MKKPHKTALAVGITTSLALALAIPFFSDATKKDVANIAKNDFSISESVTDFNSDNTDDVSQDDTEVAEEKINNLSLKDLDKYDSALQKIGKKYLDKGYYLTDLEESAKAYDTGFDNPNSKGSDDKYLTNGFDVSDSDDGNNTVYMAFIKMSHSDFKDWLDLQASVKKSNIHKKGAVTTVTIPKERTVIKYDKSTKIMSYKFEIGEGVG